MSEKMEISSSKVKYSEKFIDTVYDYETTYVEKSNGKLLVHPITKTLDIQTERQLPRLGLMLVGWGGNNGSTLTAALEANRMKMTWRTKEGVKEANWFGSITQASTVLVGSDVNFKDVYLPMKDFVPMIEPSDLIVGGWDISSFNIGDSMRRAEVLDVNLQDQLYDKLSKMKPLPSIYDSEFIAANQSDRADNCLGGTRFEQFMHIRQDIRDFKSAHNLDKILVLWTANTERFSEVRKGLNMTMQELEDSLKRNESEISPSTIFAMASIVEGAIYINGSPQNTFVPGCLEMAEHHGAFIAGDDFKSGQTKLKSVLVDFLVGAGIKPVSIVSYNHLGNNDGKNLSAPSQFRSKEISKSNVVDDMVESNDILYKPQEHPDHCVVIKYVPYVGDSKRAMDEYTSEIMMGGHNTLVIHNTCEDSLLASPLILDLVILGELCSRIKIKDHNKPEAKFESCKSVLSLLSFLCKAPLVPKGTQVVNSLFRQRAAIENVLRACVGLSPNSHMALEQRYDFSSISITPTKTKISTLTTTSINNTNGANGMHHEVPTNGHHQYENGHNGKAVVNGYH